MQLKPRRIAFGGPGAPAGPAGRSGAGPPPSVDSLVQEFLHFAGKIWFRDLPNPAPDATAAAVAAYRAYREAGGEVPLGDGLDLEESYLVAQLVARQPLMCLLNSEMPATETARIARLRRLTAGDLLAELLRRCPPRLDSRRDLAGQLRRWGQLAPAFPSLVFDGVTGHCILLHGVERGTGSLIFWDPWPLRSLLCAENNQAGVDARPVPSDEPFWTLPPQDMARVLYAVFVPA